LATVVEGDLIGVIGENPFRGYQDERVEASACQFQDLGVFREQVVQAAPTFCGLDLGGGIAASMCDFGCPQ